MSGSPTAVVLRALGLGDLITGLPALRMLRAALPEHRIALATPARWAPIVERAGTVDDLLDTAELAPVPAQNRPELAIDLHGNGPASRSVLAVLEPQRLLAYAGGRVRWRRDEHEVARWCRLLGEGLPPLHVAGLLPRALGVPFPSVTGCLGPPPAGASVTVLHAGAAAASRRWPPARLAAMATLLTGEGHDVVVTGGPGEEALAGEVAAGARVRAATGLTLEQLLALTGNARLVISGDTGVAHLASVYAVPSVTLFGPVSPARWGPPGHPRHQVVWHGDDTGDPHGTEPDPALMRITVAEVMAAAHRALAADRVRRR